MIQIYLTLVVLFCSCPNGELFDYLTQVVRLSEKKTRQIMRNILEAVQWLHNMNVVHRDLKVRLSLASLILYFLDHSSHGFMSS